MDLKFFFVFWIRLLVFLFVFDYLTNNTWKSIYFNLFTSFFFRPFFSLSLLIPITQIHFIVIPKIYLMLCANIIYNQLLSPHTQTQIFFVFSVFLATFRDVFLVGRIGTLIVFFSHLRNLNLYTLFALLCVYIYFVSIHFIEHNTRYQSGFRFVWVVTSHCLAGDDQLPMNQQMHKEKYKTETKRNWNCHLSIVCWSISYFVSCSLMVFYLRLRKSILWQLPKKV